MNAAQKTEPIIYSEKALVWLMEYWLCLPLTLTDRKSRWVRIVGLLLFFAWFLPAGILWLPVTVLALVSGIFETIWKEGQ